MDARVAAVEPLPLVPATSTAGKPFSGCPSAANSTRMCARSNLCAGVCANSWPNAYICATAVSYDKGSFQLSVISYQFQSFLLGYPGNRTQESNVALNG